MRKLAVIAIGGNSLIKDKDHQTVEDQYKAICETVEYIAEIVEQGYEVVITHGNGPQVGFILRRGEIAYKVEGLHLVPLVSCVADTQGAIGYQIQQALGNEFKKRGINKQAVTVVTLVEVAKDDSAFSNPTKPIGSFYTEEEAKKLLDENPDWTMVNDAGRGYRRVVPSPVPRRIVELEAIKRLLDNGFCVIATGGGGIPVTRNEEGYLENVDAVIDKDFASSLLASHLNADLFVISTGVEMVYLNFGKPDQKPLDTLTIAEAKKYIREGHFAKGSMLPKIQAAIAYLERGGKKAIITNPESLGKAVRGEGGTYIKA
jgi:carbamate kinase